MKKLFVMTLFAVLCVPAFAHEKDCDGDKCPMKKDRPAVMEQQKDKKHGDFKKARKQHKAKMKATEDKVEKLVEEYNKLKPGKKKEAKKAELAAVVASIHEEQLKFKEGQLKKFQARLEAMKKSLEEQQTDAAKKAWVEKKTDELISEDGDLDVLFEGPSMKGKNFPAKRGHKGPRHDGKLPPPASVAK